MKTLTIAAAGFLGLAAMPANAADLAPAPPTALGFVTANGVDVATAAFGDRKDRRRYRSGRGLYDDRGRYYEPRRISRRDRMWRGDDGRYYCKRDNGTTGLVIGAGVGALAGHELAGRGDRTLGAILGGAVGALVGREIDPWTRHCEHDTGPGVLSSRRLIPTTDRKAPCVFVTVKSGTFPPVSIQEAQRKSMMATS